jgi:hypothetical protein
MPRKAWQFDGNRIVREWGVLNEALKTHWPIPGIGRDRCNVLHIRLYWFMKWCAINKIRPGNVTDEIIVRHMVETNHNGSLTEHTRRERWIRAAWNAAAEHVPAWPRVTVSTPPPQPHRNRRITRFGVLVSLAKSEFHPSLHAEVRRYCESGGIIPSHEYDDAGKPASYQQRMQKRMSELHSGSRVDPMPINSGRPLKRLRSTTAYSHARTIYALASTLHIAGVADVRSLRRIADVITPQAAAVMADTLDKRRDPHTHNMRFASYCVSYMCSIARRCHLPLSWAEWAALRGLAQELLVDVPRTKGLSDRNRRRLAQFDDPRNFAMLIALPDVMFAELENSRQDNVVPSIREARSALVAVAIEILNTLPIRLGSVVALDLDRNFAPPWRRDQNATLTVFPDQEKTEKTLEASLSPRTWKLLSLFCRHYRPLLPGAADSRLLLPAVNKHSRYYPTVLSARIRRIVKARLKVDINPNLWRHLMSTKLSEWTGSQEDGVKLLGHVHESRADQWYVRVDTKAAAERLRILTDQVRAPGIACLAPGKRRGQKRPAKGPTAMLR